jgi:hypothetical protein
MLSVKIYAKDINFTPNEVGDKKRGMENGINNNKKSGEHQKKWTKGILQKTEQKLPCSCKNK